MNNTYTGVVPKRLYGTGIAIRGGAIDNSDGGLQMIISETATPTKPAEPETGIPNGEEVNVALARHIVRLRDTRSR